MGHDKKQTKICVPMKNMRSWSQKTFLWTQVLSASKYKKSFKFNKLN